VRRFVRLARRVALWAAIVYVVVPVGSALVYALVPPPITPLMVLRLLQGEGLQRDWVPLEAISPRLARAVIAAEDNLFCSHHGFDWESMRDAYDDFMAGKRTRGASTLSMQTAKNLFLWPHSSFVRKALEPYPTLVLELVWSKRRILEVYLNIAEWGPGIYGAEAAARAHFGKSASELGKREAALLAAVLPNPLVYSASAPSDYVAGRASTIAKRVGQLGELTDCVVPR
jgi:monofunctional biosynthetic peptidoglycan transglycosylase